jgi:hypothetical protein
VSLVPQPLRYPFHDARGVAFGGGVENQGTRHGCGVLFIDLESQSAYVNRPWKYYSTSVSHFLQKNPDTSHRDNSAVSLFRLVRINI